MCSEKLNLYMVEEPRMIQFIPDIRLFLSRVVSKLDIADKTFAAGQDLTIYCGGLAKDLERAVLNSITTYSYLSDTHANKGHSYQQSVLYLRILSESKLIKKFRILISKLLDLPHLFLCPKASMVSTKKLIKMTRMWKKLDAIGRKRITSPRSSTGRETANPNRSNKSSVVDKGHFVVSTLDKKRFCDSLGACKEQYFP
ncbi:hypothetical protein GQ457_04G011700 [Hibiscus cannabinus]